MRKIIFLLPLSLVSCHSTTDSGAASPPPQAKPAASQQAKPAGAPSPAAAQTASKFLRWYKQHYESVNQHYFLNNADGRDTTKFYSVNPAATEIYLAALRKSNCLSEACLGRWRRYIQQQGDSLRIHPQNDGPPHGFDFDLVLHSQEPDIYWDGIGRAPLTTTYPSANRVLVTADFSSSPDMPDQLLFYLRHYPVGWRIDSIDVGR